MRLPSYERQVEILLGYYFEGQDMELVHEGGGERYYQDPNGIVWCFSADKHGGVTFSQKKPN